LDDYHRQPPPLHPARNTVSAEIKEAKEKEKERPFNKHENRKSIRYIAQDWKRKTLLRNKDSSKDSGGGGGKDSGKEVKQEEAKPERRKSTSMWGHRLVEVTPGKLSAMQVPPTIPESPASDGKSSEFNHVGRGMIT
jgi:mitogen-activated protein kinase kinase kinase